MKLWFDEAMVDETMFDETMFDEILCLMKFYV